MTPNNDAQILELFPTPVYTTMVPDSLGDVLPWIHEQPMMSDGIDSDNYGDRSSSSYILDDENTIELKKFILNEIKKFGDTLGYDYESYRVGQSWISHKHPGQHHTMHSHPNSLISGVFYFGEPTDDTPAIKFHKATGGIGVSSIKPKTVADKRLFPLAWDEFSIPFQPGRLLLFPSYLHHSVPLNKSNSVRCSIAFNSVPSIGFGSESNLTELKFG